MTGKMKCLTRNEESSSKSRIGFLIDGFSFNCTIKRVIENEVYVNVLLAVSRDVDVLRRAVGRNLIIKNVI